MIVDTVETVKTVEIVETVDTVRMDRCEIVKNVLRNNYRKKEFIQHQCYRPAHAACYSYRVYLSSLFFRSITHRRNSSSSSFLFFLGGDNQIVDPIFNAKFLKRK